MEIISAGRTNPFGSNELARDNSAYTAWDGGKLIHPLEPARTPAPLAEFVHNSFRAHVLNSEFPCVGGKAAVSNNTYRFGLYGEMNAAATTAGLAFDLFEYARELPRLATDYATFVASFVAPVVRDELRWETLLWAQLQSLYELDRPLHDWDASVSNEPTDAEFSFSFAGTAFFVVGLHPLSSRYARRFPWLTLAFNAHSQFENLREQNKFDRMSKTIRARDYKLQGSINPNLSDFGDRSESRQYSGRAVEENWRCPFHVRGGDAEQPSE